MTKVYFLNSLAGMQIYTHTYTPGCKMGSFSLSCSGLANMSALGLAEAKRERGKGWFNDDGPIEGFTNSGCLI